MQKDAAFIHSYVSGLVWASIACAVAEVAFLFTFRKFSVMLLEDKLLLGMYVLLIAIFLLVAYGLSGRKGWSYGAVLGLSAVGSLLFASLFVAGAFLGGFLLGLEYIVGTSLQPADAIGFSREVMFLLLPFLLFFNPFNLYLFTRNVTIKSMFVPPQAEASALKRKEY